MISMFSKFSPIIEDFNQASFTAGSPDGPLVAQDKTYVRYEIRVNRPMYEHIAKKGLHDATNLPAKGDFAKRVQFPNTSIELKAAWRDLSSLTASARNRYFWVDAHLVDPDTGHCITKPMGLVGLHIVQKTANRPEWIWSSFEHVDNLDGSSPSFRDPMKPSPKTQLELNKTKPAPITPANKP
jgi:hypothetical protein